MLHRIVLGIVALWSVALVVGPDICASEVVAAGDTVQREMDVQCADTLERKCGHPLWGSEYYRQKWVKQLFANGFRIHEPGINYPKFMRFCLKVYNWGDRTFNSYDPEYVVGTGKNWKLYLNSHNWAQSYALFFPENLNVRMLSNVYSDLGPSINFMAVGLSYTFNANELFGHPVAQRRNFDWNFTCALFTFRYTRQSTGGGVTIMNFGKYNDGHHISQDFNDIRQKSTTIDG